MNISASLDVVGIISVDLGTLIIGHLLTEYLGDEIYDSHRHGLVCMLFLKGFCQASLNSYLNVSTLFDVVGVARVDLGLSVEVELLVEDLDALRVLLVVLVVRVDFGADGEVLWLIENLRNGNRQRQHPGSRAVV